jgi:hypothetical protein
MSNDKSMAYISGEQVETDGVYADENNYEVTLKRGDTFPADKVLGQTTWELKGFSLNEAEIDHHQKENTPPRLHIDRHDK